jgi:copper(I)-binding protein
MVALYHHVRFLLMPGLRPSALHRPGNAARAGVLIALIALVAAGLAGCGEAQASGPVITLLSAQVTEPNSAGVTEAYVIVQNKGAPDAIIGARSSAGGVIELRSPTGQSGTILMRTVTSITVPARSLFRLDPNGPHLLISGSGPMQAGREITLTLIFKHAGAISVPAMVTNPQTGGASYFLN